MPAALFPMMRGTSMFKNYRPTTNQARQMSNQARWKVINHDVKAIGRRMDTEIESVYETSEPTWSANSAYKRVGVKSEDWKGGNRLATILPIGTHEITHIVYGDETHILRGGFGEWGVSHYVLRDIETRADTAFAIRTGIALELSRHFLRSAQKNYNYSLEAQPNDRHPANLERARYLMELHKENRTTPKYLDGRFWKLRFVLDSYACEHEEYEKSLFSKGSKVVAQANNDNKDNDAADTVKHTSHYLALPRSYRGMIDNWFKKYHLLAPGHEVAIEDGYFVHNEPLHKIFDYFNGPVNPERYDNIRIAMRNLATIKKYFDYSPEEIAAIVVRMPEKEYKEFIQELRACIQQVRKSCPAWMDNYLGKKVVEPLYKALIASRTNKALRPQCVDQENIVMSQVIRLNEKEEDYSKARLTLVDREVLSRFNNDWQRHLLKGAYFKMREQENVPLADMRLD